MIVFSFMWLANEMKINMPLELDFTQEARNAEKVARIFRDFDWLKVKEIHILACDRSRLVT